MRVPKSDVRVSKLASPDQFTGTVWNEVLAVGQSPSRLHVARVTFSPGARTAWHTHPHGQVLLALAGAGRVHKAGEPAVVLHPGDSVSIAAGERHWHGAALEHVFVHIAMQDATPEGQMATWMEHVTDGEYETAPQ